jgi:cob(I)alamin adenosyltransferase
VVASQIERLEHAIDRLNEPLEPLRSFLLPGGTKEAAGCHLARTICRRAERKVCTLAKREPINPSVLIYLNRLSDLLFVLSRVYNKEVGDVLWKPGGNQHSDDA